MILFSKPCPQCGGTGLLPVDFETSPEVPYPCPACHSGMVPDVREGGGMTYPFEVWAKSRWPEDNGMGYRIGRYADRRDAEKAIEQWPLLDCRILTGDCEVDCQEACAYPGEFSECETGETGDKG